MTCTSFGCSPEFAVYHEVDAAQLAVGLGIAGAAWMYGIIDAPGAARRSDERRVEVSAMPSASGARVRVRVPL